MAEDTTQNGTAIAVFRELRGISRNGMVDKILKLDTGLKVSYSHYANIENEYKNATPPLIHALATLLDVPVAAICRKAIYAKQEPAA